MIKLLVAGVAFIQDELPDILTDIISPCKSSLLLYEFVVTPVICPFLSQLYEGWEPAFTGVAKN